MPAFKVRRCNHTGASKDNGAAHVKQAKAPLDAVLQWCTQKLTKKQKAEAYQVADMRQKLSFGPTFFYEPKAQMPVCQPLEARP